MGAARMFGSCACMLSGYALVQRRGQIAAREGHVFVDSAMLRAWLCSLHADWSGADRSANKARKENEGTEAIKGTKKAGRHRENAQQRREGACCRRRRRVCKRSAQRWTELVRRNRDAVPGQRKRE